jgi:hypothetical protein
MSLFITNPCEDAYWEEQEKQNQAREQLGCDLTFYIEKAKENKMFPEVVEFIKTYRYRMEAIDEIERHFEKVLIEFQ